jgi:ubiquinone/menaquinone biosynthesis C-methylase UbiE
MVTAPERFAFTLSQAARVGWFFSQTWLASRMARPGRRRIRVTRPTLSTQDFLAEVGALMARDRRNVAAGYYRPPHDMVPRPDRMLAMAIDYFRDRRDVDARRQRDGNAEVFRAPPDGTSNLPRYYRQNFHYQTDGYLSEHSARLYDYQVEMLFVGAADAMRRQALVPLYHALQGRNPAETRLLDLASGTGRFLGDVKHTWPALDVTALDLSLPYLQEAREQLARWPDIRYIMGTAEAIPAPDASFDIVTCIYLFHELPRKVRRQVAAEVARVLKPGGRFIFVESLQRGDRPDMDGMLEHFPQSFHEPYYTDYTLHDLHALFTGAGLRQTGSTLAFVSKVLVFDKP